MSISSGKLFPELETINTVKIHYNPSKLQNGFEKAFELAKESIRTELTNSLTERELRVIALSTVNNVLSQASNSRFSVLDNNYITIKAPEYTHEGNIIPSKHYPTVDGFRKDFLSEDFEKSIVKLYERALFYGLISK